MKILLTISALFDTMSICLLIDKLCTLFVMSVDKMQGCSLAKLRIVGNSNNYSSISHGSLLVLIALSFFTLPFPSIALSFHFLSLYLTKLSLLYTYKSKVLENSILKNQITLLLILGNYIINKILQNVLYKVMAK